MDHTERFEAAVARHEIPLAIKAAMGYQQHGRGAVLIDMTTLTDLAEDTAMMRVAYVTKRPADVGDERFEQAVAEYDPTHEMVVVGAGDSFEIGRYPMPEVCGDDVDETTN